VYKNELISLNLLPTHLALTARRVNISGVDGGAETFLTASYVIEIAIKTIGITLYSGLKQKAPEQAYRMGYELIRADGLGIWDGWIRSATSQPAVGFLPPTFSELVSWANKIRSKPEDEWFREAVIKLNNIFDQLGLSSGIPERKPTIKDMISSFVQLRNKTKAHGALGNDFFHAVNIDFISTINAFLITCPCFKWKWVHLLARDSGKNRGILLSGMSPTHLRESEIAEVKIERPGIHVWPPNGQIPISTSDLLSSNRECSDFFVPNGGYSDQQAWYINYATGNTSQIEQQMFATPPAPLPPSETQGMLAFDVQNNIFGNLPPEPVGYVTRKLLEDELERRLRDRNHPIITLHGRGGIGKTSLALKLAHILASEAEPLFEYLVWFSARDIDLRPRGPAGVRPTVTSLLGVAKFYGELFGVEGSIDSFAQILHSPKIHSNRGILFIFDNFETMDDVKELHQFLDLHTHLPNKILITSRERAFKADFPIEVQGMEKEEARQLIFKSAQSLGIESLISDDIIDRLYDYSEGHPYVIRVVVGEIAIEGRYESPKTLLPKRLDIVNAVFERSFNKLSEEGRRVFLIISCWKSIISELALLVVLGQRGIDVESGIEECLRLSLVERRYFLNDQPAYTAPQVARLFGKKKLEGDPDRLLIQEDLGILQKFGVIPTSEPVQIPQDDALNDFIGWCINHAIGMNIAEQNRIDIILESLAELWPDGWIGLAQYRLKNGNDSEAIDYALRRSVEEQPSNKKAFLLRADYAKQIGDNSTFIASYIRAAELDPKDKDLIREVALQVCRYINEHIAELPPARRGVYLASIRSLMMPLASELDATGLSRLAWLFLLEGKEDLAYKYAGMGLAKDADNSHCQKMIDRLRQSS